MSDYAIVNCIECGLKLSEICTIEGRCFDCDLDYQADKAAVV